MPIHPTYEPRLVALSFVVASLASFVALDLAGRTQAASGRTRIGWLAGGSVVMGVGIWSMHFIGMLAFGLSANDAMMMIAYDRVELVESVLVAIAASALALSVASRVRLVASGLIGGGCLMGGAIAGMHYLGMAAMRMSATLSYSAPLVVLSIVIAVVASIVALALARRLGETRTSRERWAKRAAAAVMGVAIAGMHYTAMAAAHFGAPNAATRHIGDSVLATSGLAVAVTIASLIVLAVATAATAIDRRHGQLDRTARSTEARFHSLTQAVSDAVFCADAGGRIVFWNSAAERMFGHPAADVIGQAPSMLFQNPPRTATAAKQPLELEARRHDGSTFPAELTLTEWAGEDEPFTTGIVRDITERKRAEASLRQSEEQYRTLVEHSPEAIVLHAHGFVLYANPAAAALVGEDDPSKLRGKCLVEFIHPESRALVASQMAAPSVEWKRKTLEYRVLHADGRVVFVEATSVAAAYDRAPAVQTHLRDVTGQKALEAQLEHQAFHDTLTGIANRALFRDRVDHAMARVTRRRASAVLFLDVDNFKAVNDGLGHTAGDELLCLIARRLTHIMRPSDTCARLGGDEFGILIDDAADAADAAHVAERIIGALREPCSIGGAEIAVSVSIGIAVIAPGETVVDVLRNADVAMYRAKSRGKGCYQVFEPTMHEAVRSRLELESELRRAVERCERSEGDAPPFTLHYQPIASLATGAVTSAEALVRWRHPERGLVAPLDFIPIAEETGLIVPLGRWILREACRQTKAWQLELETRKSDGDWDSSALLGVTVNISARQLSQPDLVDDVRAALAASGLAPGALTLEMTESMLVDHSPVMLARLDALKAVGVRLAIDDFGTGYSSLGYLEQFPVDLLKIDKSFIDHLGGSGRESPLARAILGLGRELGMRVVAEGIETEAQWSRLAALGCDLGQGYYLSRPVSAEEVLDFLARPALRFSA